MRKMLTILVIGFMTTSCAMIATPHGGMLFTDAKSNSNVATGVKAKKMGTACTVGVIGIVTGDSSVATAMKNGKISKVSYVDHTVNNILGVYNKYCTVVYGK